ncbi:MAG: DNA cytosine methyltransferase [Candidatus Handelsmanbacteria bacterium]|nr:DNA cytosine methyltransferase [Candidatus Handelsmanbacteria bacterium]
MIYPMKNAPIAKRMGMHTLQFTAALTGINHPRPLQSGLYSPGRGRYIHLSQGRVFTPREAAIVRGFPDQFVFSQNREAPPRKLLFEWIGDAVPSWLGTRLLLLPFRVFE